MFTRKSALTTLLAVGSLLLTAIGADAHTGFYQVSGGFFAGLEHPWLGFDHLLAMIAVGLWAVQIEGRVVWMLPLAFVGTMILGGLAGAYGLTLPLSEQMIVFSDLLLGVLILLAVRWSVAGSIGLVALLALFHGVAHGAEMPHSAIFGWYVAGFVVSTCSLHGLGMGLGTLMQQYLSPVVIRVAGGLVLVGGLLLTFKAV
jgi:urease accessory protein